MMKNSNKVSIIITTYDGLDNIERAVKSTLVQTYKNIEVIVVDDNGYGTDKQKETKKILSKWIESEKITYIAHEHNKNGSAARNTGWKASAGKYICFLDDDDYYMPEKVQEEVKLFENSNEEIQLVFCGILHRKNGFPDREEIAADLQYDLFTEFRFRMLPVCSSTIMVRRDRLERIGGFDESFARHQDWECIARILMDGGLALNVRKALVVKEQIGRNIPSNAKKTENCSNFFLKKMEPLIVKQTAKHQRKIYFDAYLLTAKVYFDEYNMKKVIEYSIKSKRPVYFFLRAAWHHYKKINNKF